MTSASIHQSIGKDRKKVGRQTRKSSMNCLFVRSMAYSSISLKLWKPRADEIISAGGQQGLQKQKLCKKWKKSSHQHVTFKVLVKPLWKVAYVNFHERRRYLISITISNCTWICFATETLMNSSDSDCILIKSSIWASTLCALLVHSNIQIVIHLTRDKFLYIKLSSIRKYKSSSHLWVLANTYPSCCSRAISRAFHIDISTTVNDSKLSPKC